MAKSRVRGSLAPHRGLYWKAFWTTLGNAMRHLLPLFLSFILVGAVSAERRPAVANEALLGELRELVDKAARERAADRWLQRDLENLVRKYSPRRMHELLFENFRDGDYTRNPTWEVMQGRFEVYRRHGLVSSVDRRRPQRRDRDQASDKEAIKELVLGAILGGTRKESPEPRGSDDGNVIALRADIPNSFALEFGLRLEPGRRNRLDLLLLQGRDGRYGYRLRLNDGRNKVARLYRIARGSEKLLYETDLPSDAGDGERHDLAWRHGRRGRLEILFDGQPLMSLRDRSFRDGYPWLVLRHLRGSMALRSVRLSGWSDS